VVTELVVAQAATKKKPVVSAVVASSLLDTLFN
jgi:hypothetical protein